MNWKPPKFNEKGMTEWNWMVQYHDNLILGENTDIGAFTYINAKYGVEIQDNVQIGSHCSIYSESTIDKKQGQVIIKRNAKIGTHSVIMPGITIGENALIGAFSFVNKDIPDNALAWGVTVSEVTSAKIEHIEGKTAVPLLKDASEVTGIWDFLGGVDPEEHIRELRE